MSEGIDRSRFDAEKAACRTLVRRRVAELDETARAACSTRLVRHLVASEPWRRARSVALFLPIGREPDLRLAIEIARTEGRVVLLPRSVADPPAVELVPIGDVALESLPQDPLGVPAPNGPARPLDDSGSPIDLVVVPGVAFDRLGGRLGRGGGFYDRLLESLRARTCPPIVGACFDCQRVDRVPRAAHDEPVDHLCTETGFDGPLPHPAGGEAARSPTTPERPEPNDRDRSSRTG